MKLIECVPNFSEGRRKEVIEAIIDEARKFNVKILDDSPDADHNRTDVTFIGEPEEVKKAALAM
ncbi:MAG: glutamate formiminotransferase, partial [Thermoplasmata archaeon]